MKYNSTKDPIRIYNEILGGKWRLLILYQLFNRTQRFRDLGQNIEGITPRMLTKELRTLEKYNLVEKEVYREVPPRVEYSLTDDGVRLYPLIENIINFGENFSYLLHSSEEDLVQRSLERTAKMKVMEIDLTSEPDIVYAPKEKAKVDPIEELIETKSAIEVEDLSHVRDLDSEDMIIEKEVNAVTELEEVKEEPINIGQKNAEILKKLKPEKKKKIKISENTNAVQLELF